MSSTPPLEILLSNVQSVNFPASAVEGMMCLEMNFTCGMLTNLLHGEEISLATSEKVHKLVVVLEVDNTERANLFQVRTTTVINHRCSPMATIYFFSPARNTHMSLTIAIRIFENLFINTISHITSNFNSLL